MTTLTHNQEDALHTIPLRITDTTLRDAHQSLWATRMRTEDILGIIDTIDNVGYYSLEMWGGATFDVCMRFLRESPWERLREIKKRAKNTPLQMLLRGQNLVGYKNYADDVVDKFIALAVKNGIDIFRCFDALNDPRNLETAIGAVKKYGGHAQGAIAYTISPVHTVENYVAYARELVQLGVDSVCIKDMAGILTPLMAERLVSALIGEFGTTLPIQIHSHMTSGMATAAYVEGVRAGAGAIDCSVASMAGTTSQPPVETLAAIFKETSYATEIDIEAINRVSDYFHKLSPKRRSSSGSQDMAIDPNILIHQIPGGMISNFRSQLEMQGALDKLDMALDEVTRVREDLGYPPLVTPTSQIVGTQAVMNVLSGERYKIVPNEVREYVRGKYGRSPAPIADEFVKQILGDEKPITTRPGAGIAPQLGSLTDDLDSSFVKEDEDILSYALFPEVSIEYFKWRAQPEDQRDPIPADLEMAEASANKASSDKPEADIQSAAVPSDAVAPMVHMNDYEGIGHIIRQSSGISLDEMVITKGDFSVCLRANGAISGGSVQPIAQPKKVESAGVDPVSSKAEPVKVAEEAPASSQASYKHAVVAPLNGTFYLSSSPGATPLVSVGDTVKAGDTVCIVEAMKLFNEIKATESGVVTAVLAEAGKKVQKGDALIGIN